MLTAEDKERRRKYVTATDTPPLFGESKWRNLADVYAEKVYGTIPTPSTEVQQAGHDFEVMLLKYASERIGLDVSPGEFVVGPNGLNAATLDGLAADGSVIECKTAGLFHYLTGEDAAEWGPDGSDEIPNEYFIQVQAQMYCKEAPRAFVPAWIGGRGKALYEIAANADAQRAIVKASERFWKKHVEAMVPPEDVAPSLETIKAIRRQPGKVIQVADELVVDFRTASQARLAAEKVEKEAKQRLLDAIGDAEGGYWSGGQFTYMPQTRRGYQVAPSSNPVLKFLKEKGE